MAAARLAKFLKFGENLLKPSIRCSPLTSIGGRRTLFSQEILGMDSYNRFRSQTNDRLRDLKGRFSSRMTEYMAIETNSIFTDDLKNMIALADSDDDLAIAEQMIKRYYTQSSESVLRQFTFGPVIMRMLYAKKKPDLALSLFMDPTLKGLFTEISSCVVLMDMLYEAERYEETLKVYNQFIEDRENAPKKRDFFVNYPSDPTTLAFASLCKLNTKESLDTAKNLVTSLTKSGAKMTNRGAGFVSYLALNQDDAVYGYEVLGLLRQQQLATVRNLKVQCLSKLSRFDEALAILRSVLLFHTADDTVRGNDIFPDSLDAMESLLKAANNPELIQQFETTRKSLEDGGHVSQKTFAEFIGEPVRLRRRVGELRQDSSRRYGGGGGMGGGDGDRRSFAPRQSNWRRPAFDDDGDDFAQDDRRMGRPQWGRGGDDDGGQGRDRWPGQDRRWPTQGGRFNQDGRQDGRFNQDGRQDGRFNQDDRFYQDRYPDQEGGRWGNRGRRFNDDRGSFRRGITSYDEGS